MEDSRIIQMFLDYLKFERRFSEHTAKCYGADLSQFGEFLHSISDGDSHDTDHMEHDHGEGGTATAVATQTLVMVDQLSSTSFVSPVAATTFHRKYRLPSGTWRKLKSVG